MDLTHSLYYSNNTCEKKQGKKMSEIVQNFIEHAHLDKKIERFLTGVTHNVEHEQNTMPANIFDTYQKIILRLFDSTTLVKELKQIILMRFDEQKMQKMLDFMCQPNLQLIIQKEENAKSLQASQEMQIFFTGLQATPPSKKRKNIIEKIDKVLGSSALVVDMQITLFQSVAWGMRKVNPNYQEMTQVQLQQMASEMKEKMSQQITQQIWMSMLFAYKDVSDDELQDYLTLNESTEGQFTTAFIRTAYFDMYEHTTKQLQYALEAEFT